MPTRSAICWANRPTRPASFPRKISWMEGTPRVDWKPYVSASRLSYSLWDTTPDDELLRSAARGELDTTTGVERTARRMLADPRSRTALDEFTSQWLRFDRALAAAR